MCKRLSADISRIKQQKVALQKAMEASARQFSSWRQDREKVPGGFMSRVAVFVVRICSFKQLAPSLNGRDGHLVIAFDLYSC
jgi:hypothetical protein